MKSNRAVWVRYTVIDTFLIIMLAAMYFALNRPNSLPVMNPTTISYKGSSDDSIAMQFVVTWDSSALGAIIDTLRDNDIRVTFFVSGKYATENSDTILLMTSDGHSIGTIGMDPNEPVTLESLEQSVAIIESISGTEVKLFHNSTASGTGAVYAKQLGLMAVLCTNDLVCGRGNDSDIYDRAKASASAGNIIQLTPTLAAVDALPDIIDLYRNRGYKILSTQDLLISN